MKRLIASLILLFGMTSISAFATCSAPGTTYLTDLGWSGNQWVPAQVSGGGISGCQAVLSNLTANVANFTATVAFTSPVAIWQGSCVYGNTAYFQVVLTVDSVNGHHDDYQMPAGTSITIPAGQQFCVGFLFGGRTGSTTQGVDEDINVTVEYK